MLAGAACLLVACMLKRVSSFDAVPNALTACNMFLAGIQTAPNLITLQQTAVRQRLCQYLHRVALANRAQLSDQSEICTSSSNVDSSLLGDQSVFHKCWQFGATCVIITTELCLCKKEQENFAPSF